MKILYYLPSYHSSFFEREALIRRGHEVDIYVPPGYPAAMLWSREGTFTVPASFIQLEKLAAAIWFPQIFARLKFVLMYFATNVPRQLWLIRLFKRYDCVYVFGRTDFLDDVPFLRKRIRRNVRKGSIRFRILPAGCRDEALQSYWKTFEGGRVCGNCFIQPQCDDRANALNIARIRNLEFRVAGNGSHRPPELAMESFRSRSLDLKLWAPGIEVPEKFRLPENGNIRVLHSFASNGRGGARNIKGSLYVQQAVERLQSKGHKVELISVTDLKATEVRFVQVQCDIIVDQLIYGWWGSTALEGIALGKPVVCFLRDSFRETFSEQFPDLADHIPFVNADIENIEAVLEQLLANEDIRQSIGQKSRDFAEMFVDPDKNVIELEAFLSSQKD